MAYRYEELNDEELVQKGRSGDTTAVEHLFARYKPMVNAKSRAYFLVGADRDDIIQEGMIGLFKAIRDYDDKKECKFCYFAELCVVRQIITAVKTATRKKHSPLNSYISLYKPVFDEDPRVTYTELISNGETNPELRVVHDETKRDMVEVINHCLSKMEKRVLFYYLSGLSYLEISQVTNISIKSIDNALQRIKKKLSLTTVRHRKKK